CIGRRLLSNNLSRGHASRISGHSRRLPFGVHFVGFIVRDAKLDWGCENPGACRFNLSVRYQNTGVATCGYAIVPPPCRCPGVTCSVYFCDKRQEWLEDTRLSLLPYSECFLSVSTYT